MVRLRTGGRSGLRYVRFTSMLRKKGFRGDVRAAGMTAMSLGDALPGGLTACGGPLASGLVT